MNPELMELLRDFGAVGALAWIGWMNWKELRGVRHALHAGNNKTQEILVKAMTGELKSYADWVAEQKQEAA